MQTVAGCVGASMTTSHPRVVQLIWCHGIRFPMFPALCIQKCRNSRHQFPRILRGPAPWCRPCELMARWSCPKRIRLTTSAKCSPKSIHKPCTTMYHHVPICTNMYQWSNARIVTSINHETYQSAIESWIMTKDYEQKNGWVNISAKLPSWA